eukprot:comp22917_c1_seq2/m.36271 comp22917_c1_seq2/g.36271  ORF comp22917_c1_seq2/g.36271 comp22917_c1_seq2/m.36271 type:complete len:416 (-) comp22917_c1_seq2:394-1641(-)
MASKGARVSLDGRPTGNRSRHNSERRESISVDDDVELAVPEHKLGLDGGDDDHKRVNPVRKHLKAKSPGVQDSAAFTYDSIAALDPQDPNYDPTEYIDHTVALEVIEPEHPPPELRKPLELLYGEYFDNGDSEEFLENMIEKDSSEAMRIAAVVVGVEMALERKDSERELVSRLLVDAGTRHAISEPMMVRGFDTLLASAGDLVLDNPEAPQLLAYFIGRAIADDVLHPSFVSSRLDMSNDDAREVVRTAHTLINMRHGLARLDSVWKGGACRRSITALVEQMAGMLREYVASGDIKEAERQIRAWHVPHFHHEIVFDAVGMALEFGNMSGKEAKVASLMRLLETFSGTNLISDEQMQLGFDRVLKGLNDLAVDIPTAKRDIVYLVQQGVSAGYLPADFTSKAEAAAAQPTAQAL